MKVLITGATGMIGQEVVKLCHQSNIVVHYLTTSEDKIENKSNYKGYFWDPQNNSIDVNCLHEVEVIINLVGATVAKRWTKNYKKEIIESRTLSAKLLLNTLKNQKHTVRHMLSASAIGIYPSSLQNYYTEETQTIADDFLGTVVRQWEDAVNQFKSIDISVSILRIGLVLSEKGGAFPKMAEPVKYNLGTAFGSGKQWQSWIHVEDLARVFLHSILQEQSGVFNAVAPNPVSNQKLIKIIAKKMNKSIFLPNVPKFMMKLILGEMHTILFASQRVSCEKLLETGFNFNFDNVAVAIQDIVNKQEV
ncbi:TIGR01777 family oxidoreductase [Aquimarina sp. W85]|uniref:TIGR01777 family oxidoreductase n=1 Tax=Aquimarina rhodophyticola TaxID=3342246 RepID=UPI00367221C5